MDPDTKRELAELRALVKDNHRMLRAMRREQWYAFAARVVIWIIVLALPLYLYQTYVAPIVGSFTGTTTPSGFVFPSPAEIQQALEMYRSMGQQ